MLKGLVKTYTCGIQPMYMETDFAMLLKIWNKNRFLSYHGGCKGCILKMVTQTNF